MLSRIQWLFASLCALGILLPMALNNRTDSYVYIWQSDDGPHFLIWLVPLAAAALGRLARGPATRFVAGLLQCLLGLGTALVIWSLSWFGLSVFFSDIAWGGYLATGAAVAFAAVSLTKALLEIKAPKRTLAFSL